LHLAQINIAEAKASLESPVMAGFVNNLDRINQLADKSDGFVWRLQDENGANATQVRVFDNEFIIVNLSVWESREALFQFVYASDHVELLKKKKEWFKKMPQMHMALWYIAEGHRPSITEAIDRLEYLRTHGETPQAFTFKSKFQPIHLSQNT
jgi:hypothetical protein